MNKWQAFKQKRSQIIDRYLRLRKVQIRVQTLVINLWVSQIIGHIAKNVLVVKGIRDKHFTSCLIAKKIGHQWTKKFKARWGSMDKILTHKVRSALSLFSRI